MDKEFGLKELYEVSLKATYPIEVGDRKIAPGETIAIFDKIQVATFDEKKDWRTAKGGYDSRALIWWEETKEIKLTFTQGIFSKGQLALMTNAKILSKKQGENLLLSCRETLETDEEGKVYLKYAPQENIFVYAQKTGEKILDFEVADQVLQIAKKYEEIIIDYQYNYVDDYSYFSFGRELTSGYLALEGKTRVKDDITGHVKTGIIKIPKLKLMSTLSMRMGSNTAPLIGQLDAVAVPEGVKGQKKVMELIFLNEDIDSDM